MAKGWGLGSVSLSTSPGSVGSQSGHLNLPPFLSVDFSHMSHVGWSVMSGMENSSLNIEKNFKVSNPFPESYDGHTHICLSLNTSPGGALTTCKAALTIR